MDNPWSGQEPEPTSRATPEALYSETALGCTFSPRIRTGIAGRPNLQLTGLYFTRNSLFVRSAQNRRTSRVIRCVQLCIANGAYCTGVRNTLHRPHSCTSVVIRAVQLCASTRLRCTPVWKVSFHPYSCTGYMIQFVRVYTSYIVKVTPLSHHERRRAPRGAARRDLIDWHWHCQALR
jgi:hypothetical protein